MNKCGCGAEIGLDENMCWVCVEQLREIQEKEQEMLEKEYRRSVL